MLTARYIVALLLTVLFLSLFDYEFALGQGQTQQPTFLPYNNPNLGVSIQYPSDWQLQEESNDKLRFVKQEGFVTADLNVEHTDESETTLSEYASTRVNELQAQRPEFQLIANEPTTISNKPAQKVVYTFEREEDGKTNKVMRIWSTNEDKLYTLAYIAESGQYDRYLSSFQRMVDSFRISDSNSGSSTTQVQSSDGSRENSDGSGNCDRISYPDPEICIPPYPPDLNCLDIIYTNFRVTGPDPHGFDRDKDGIGCESADGGGVTPPNGGDGNCDPSYPDICIKSPPPDLNCPDIPNKNFKVIGSDPHGFDRDNDGIGCESANEDIPSPTPTCPEGTHGTPPDCIPIADYCYLPGIGDWWDNPDCKDYLENKYKNRTSPPSPSPPTPPSNCDVPNQPPECAPTECPDGSIVPPGEQCPEDSPDEDSPDEDSPENGDGNDDGNGDSGDGSDGDGNGDGDGDAGGDNGDQFFGN